MAGVFRRQSEDLPEGVVLMRVLRDMNFPKFVFEDVPLFLGLIKVSRMWKKITNYTYICMYTKKNLNLIKSNRFPSYFKFLCFVLF